MANSRACPSLPKAFQNITPSIANGRINRYDTTSDDAVR